MIAHAGIHVNDYDKAKEFYTKALAPLGYKLNMDMAEYKAGGFMGPEGNTDFWIGGDGVKQPNHVAFGAPNEEQVQAFYKAALEAGAKDNGAPGYRTEYGAGYYAAFVYDPDGNNIETMYWNDAK